MPQVRSQTAPEDRALYLWPDAALYIGRDVAPDTHRHSAAQCAVALDGTLLVRTEDGCEIETREAVFVDANVTHSIASPGGNVAFLYLERTFFSQWPVPAGSGQSVQGIYFLRATLDAALRARLAASWSAPLGEAEASETREGILALLLPAGARRPPVDPRIRKILGHIATHTSDHPSGERLAALAGLSPGRFQHLFTEHAGMPVRRYLLWCRIRRGIEALHDGANLTRAAHEAGFSDSAHFSRTFRAMTGIPPSEVFGRKSGTSIIFCGG
ncbi:helix-turn-helix- domain containing protein AraC type [Parvibaculum lavamentivorans DS-1]|uniref:Helix-turn-helix-domain containing protein AraC type n=1 Tax=Parvibaculum lavamentivorans (strain DS-1 / DSM 13023 / NCIMB 13966) TaxID=402881 RepID=A7HQV5_PARL1|nr:AraC family transcriptional regulator [Parvibaculum lavamentivorans]ABS62288.1 helix-turn-helix- domain containing protein AraC type [Parvibaculum lavamentivorans DS-1]